MRARVDRPNSALWGAGIGWLRLAALVVLLCAVAAVAYLDRTLAGNFDLTLIYVSITLTAALLLPRAVALALATAVAVVSVGIGGAGGLALLVNAAARVLLYGYIVLLTSQWERERRKLLRMSRIDELTGLYNLRALREQFAVWLGPALRTGRPMAVLMLDLNGFKAINDRLGHAEGNDILRRVADVLRVSTRLGDPVFRFGGDEFVVLLPDTNGAGAEAVARRIQSALEQLRRAPGGTEPAVSISIGIAVCPDDGQDPELLLARADEALYRAKRDQGERIEHHKEAA